MSDAWITGTCPDCPIPEVGQPNLKSVHSICGCCEDHCPCVPDDEIEANIEFD